jgi:1-aminocyclopropane-1-carboxylate deaminase
LKGEDKLTEKVCFNIGKNIETFAINFDYHFGGYAKSTDVLINFINDMATNHHILLDHVYNGKLFYGLFDLIDKKYFPRGSKIAVVHTGGLREE